MNSCWQKPCSAMVHDDHYYTSGYTAEDDPYVEPNGVLKNNLGKTNTADLVVAETELVNIQTADVLLVVEGQFDLQHLCNIHHFLFSPVYPWAGEFRRVDIGKQDTQFLANGLIQSRANALFAELAAESHLQGATKEHFCSRVAEYLGRLNFIHPFREGNGRTQRAFFSQLAINNGFDLDWSGCAPNRMTEACITALSEDYRQLERILLVGIKSLQLPE